MKSELRLKESQITALRDGVLSGRTQRQALLDKRRLDAVERLWTAFMGLTPFVMVSGFMSAIKFDASAEEASRNPNLRRFFSTIAGNHDEKLKLLSENQAKTEQPFVSPLAWAYFYAYQTIVLSAYMRAKMLEIGLEKPSKLFNEEGVKNLLKAALSRQSEYIDQWGASGYYYLLEELEKNLFAELQKMLRGEDEDQASIKQAARIMDLAHKAAANLQQQSPEVVQAEIRAE